VDPREVGQFVCDWVGEKIPAIESRYPYPVATKEGTLPDVVAVADSAEITRGDERFFFLPVQQLWLRIFPVTVSIMGDAEGKTPAEVDEELKAFAETLQMDVYGDATLAGNLPDGTAYVAPASTWAFDPVFIEYDDGTTGRVITGNIVVAELLAEPE
jgi:hypothetical protein